MQSKDIIKQPITTEWVVAHPNAYVHKSERTPTLIPEKKSVVVQLVNTQTYEASSHSWTDATHPTFKTTNADRTKRFLVKYTDHAGTDIYRIIDAKDFIATKAVVETAWAVRRVEEAKADALRQAQQAEETRLYEQAKASEDAVRQAVKENVLALFGPVEAEQVSTSWISATVKTTQQPDGTVKGRVATSGDVRIPVDLFLRLAERLANA